MTKQMDIDNDSDDRPVLLDEIEITPEMLEAGMGELSVYDHDLDCGFDLIRQIYRQMERVRISALTKRSGP